MWDVIFWLILGYIGLSILWRLVFLVSVTIAGYSESGFWGAIFMAFMGFLFSVWDLIKYALAILLIVVLLRSCIGTHIESMSRQGNYFVQSITAADHAVTILYYIDSTSSAGEIDKLLYQTQMALNHSDSVSISFLKEIHPDLPEQYAQNFRCGLTALSYGLEYLNDDSLDVGDSLLTLWANWYNSNIYDILSKELDL